MDSDEQIRREVPLWRVDVAAIRFLSDLELIDLHGQVVQQAPAEYTQLFPGVVLPIDYRFVTKSVVREEFLQLCKVSRTQQAGALRRVVLRGHFVHQVIDDDGSDVLRVGGGQFSTSTGKLAPATVRAPTAPAVARSFDLSTNTPSLSRDRVVAQHLSAAGRPSAISVAISPAGGTLGGPPPMPAARSPVRPVGDVRTAATFTASADVVSDEPANRSHGAPAGRQAASYPTTPHLVGAADRPGVTSVRTTPGQAAGQSVVAPAGAAPPDVTDDDFRAIQASIARMHSDLPPAMVNEVRFNIAARLLSWSALARPPPPLADEAKWWQDQLAPLLEPPPATRAVARDQQNRHGILLRRQRAAAVRLAVLHLYATTPSVPMQQQLFNVLYALLSYDLHEIGFQRGLCAMPAAEREMLDLPADHIFADAAMQERVEEAQRLAKLFRPAQPAIKKNTQSSTTSGAAAPKPQPASSSSSSSSSTSSSGQGQSGGKGKGTGKGKKKQGGKQGGGAKKEASSPDQRG